VQTEADETAVVPYAQGVHELDPLFAANVLMGQPVHEVLPAEE